MTHGLLSPTLSRVLAAPDRLVFALLLLRLSLAHQRHLRHGEVLLLLRLSLAHQCITPSHYLAHCMTHGLLAHYSTHCMAHGLLAHYSTHCVTHSLLSPTLSRVLAAPDRLVFVLLLLRLSLAHQPHLRHGEVPLLLRHGLAHQCSLRHRERSAFSSCVYSLIKAIFASE